MPKKRKESKKELECGKKKGSSLRCQIKKSTRLAFFEFFPRHDFSKQSALKIQVFKECQ